MRRIILWILAYSLCVATCGYSQTKENRVVVNTYITADGCISCLSTLIEHCRKIEKVACSSKIYVIAERSREARKRIKLLSDKGFDANYYSADSISCIRPSTYPWEIVLRNRDTIYIGPVNTNTVALIKKCQHKSSR